MNKILRELTGGDLRSDGKANEVARSVVRDPDLFPHLIEGFESPDKVIRMRTAHAVEVISRSRPELIEGVKIKLVNLAKKDGLPEVRWHLAQVFGNIVLSQEERNAVIPILFDYLKEDSILVKAWSIVTLGILAKRDKNIEEMVIDKIKPFQRDKSAAVRNRVRQVLGVLENGRK